MTSPADTALARRRWLAFGATVLAAFAFVWLVNAEWLWLLVLARLFPDQTPQLYPSATLASLTLRHVEIVAISSGLTILVGLPLGIWVTRPSGRDFRDVVAAGVDLGQTFPPVAVLALAMPVLGFGLAPTVLALFLYGLFPVVSSTIAGLDAVSHAVVDAAEGIGMGSGRILGAVELPLSARVIMGGIRTSVIIHIGTATVAAAVGAGGLGDPIIGGIAVQNPSWVFEGAVTAALLAVLADQFLARLEDLVTPEV